jgi:hypothetical protein
MHFFTTPSLQYSSSGGFDETSDRWSYWFAAIVKRRTRHG